MLYWHIVYLKETTTVYLKKKNTILFPQKPANILVMGEGPERGRVKIGMLYF
jgi:hypothetical protein